MTLDPAAVSALRATINARYVELRSWRKVQKQYYPRVAFGTLQRIACSDYLPKEPKILRALGLTGQGRRRSAVEKAVDRLARETADSVVRHKPTKREYIAVTKERNENRKL